MPAVVDASPVISLSKAGLLPLLHLAGDPVFVPLVVVQEIHRGGPNDPAVQALASTSWLVPVDPGPDDPRLRAYSLDPGEAGVLTWALQHPGTRAVLDEAIARRCAVQLGIPVRGCVGLVVLAKQQGVLPLARPALEALRQAGLYLSDYLFNQTLILVGE
jgi:predicted nucleic acid-binding protein